MQRGVSRSRQGYLEPTTAEAMAVFFAVQLCQECGVQKLIVEGDAQTVINDLKREEEHGNRFGHIIDDTKLLLGSFIDWQANHVRRMLNTAAHRLAKMASKAVIDKCWRDGIPECICYIVHVENTIST